jgi:C-terminal peptidase prc
MAQGQLRSVVRYLRDLAGTPDLEPTDRHLLERFAAARDEDAFATLVRRHGPLVWGVCQRVLGHRHDAEDAFQATFFVLARKAAAIRWRDSVSSWLHEVAYRLSNETRVKSARRRFHESTAAQAAPQSAPPGRDEDVFALLDEELHRLPAKFRTPLLQCYLQGRTSDQAARELGWSLRTLQRRLTQGRELLRSRLTRRGVTLSSVLLFAILTQSSANAALPAALAGATTQSAVAFATGVAADAGRAALLAQAFLKGMTMTRWKLAAVIAVLLAATTGAGSVVRFVVADDAVAERDEPAHQQKDAPPAAAKPAKSEVDVFAGQTWEILEVVSKQHLEPRPRAELIVAGVNALLETVNGEAPADLAKRTAAIKTPEEFAALLRPLWPQDGKTTRDALEEAFLKGVARRAGGELRVLPTEELKIQEEFSANRYVGTGIQIKMNEQENRVQIVAAIRRGPARRAGVKNDDILLKVNDKDTKGASVRTVVEWVRGEEGTPVTFVVKQPGAAETRTYTMKRGVVPFESVVGWRRAEGDEWNFRPDAQSPIAYVHVDSLRTSTLQELRQLEPKLRAQGCRALVLDFRSSSGDGTVRNGAIFADGLLDGGLMWSTRGVDEKSRKEYRADRECLFRNWPMAALIDESLDRQHALVVAALQDNHRAVLVGEPTKTDGFVNAIVKLPDGKRGLIFRTGILERADRQRGWPVKPDHVVAMDRKQRESSMEWHRKQEIAEAPTDDQAPDDPQVARALELLRDSLKKTPAEARP